MGRLLKETVALTKQHCATSSSTLYHCVHGNGLFCHPKTAIVCAASPFGTEWEASRGGGRPHANDANANLQAYQHFFPSLWGGLSCALPSPIYSQIINMCMTTDSPR